jgi:hypothetical protein
VTRRIITEAGAAPPPLPTDPLETAVRHAARLHQQANDLAGNDTVLRSHLAALTDAYLEDVRSIARPAVDVPTPPTTEPAADELAARLVSAALAFVDAAEAVADARPEASTVLLDIAAQAAQNVLEVIRTWPSS